MKNATSFTQALHTAWQKKGLISALLLPLSWVLRAIIARKRLRYQRHPELTHQSRLPVVIVGNIYVGGTGKTPVVIALAQALQARGWQPGVISRGYGATVGKQARTGQGQLDPALFGDEPALIAQATQAPVAVHPKRVLALQQLQQAYPQIDVVIADDGLQHLALGRDLEIVVQDGRGIGNGRVLPAGPLREPASRLDYIDILITNLQPGETLAHAYQAQPERLSMHLAPVRVEQLSTGISVNWTTWLSDHSQQTFSAVAAIGQPQRFFSMLSAAGLHLNQTVALPDHDAYENSPFSALSDPIILITGKDAVKCRRFNDSRLWVVYAEPVFSDPDWLERCHQRLTVIAAQKSAMADKTPRL
ncbi:tetraacyldisaccharide 4'-kinase [Pollutimonas harenae]|uniref:Tetraacyldisaccharide 4'-kinase n=1 Tax=Pollutimonas harenae TaxID=657015 RepID=A0A853H3U7_9BURK|nr:tetraacyldisaccharide 4'-kinase [Pollutimonas harenae]NYT86700.1 tetraacyldisaccharide 4'-kinase [Pollutimonas harenae]TEA71352.1 tetraacyldisaccharide 4'-kinase [Pollutimonas harenae]